MSAFLCKVSPEYSSCKFKITLCLHSVGWLSLCILLTLTKFQVNLGSCSNLSKIHHFVSSEINHVSGGAEEICPKKSVAVLGSKSLS